MEMQAQKPPAKKRKLTEKNIPNAILHSPDFGVDSQMYQDLLNTERKLDWTIARKRTEVQDALQKQAPSTRTLRIFLSHTVSGQVWQQEGAAPDGNVNIETGEGIPAWQLKIEGRLLELPNQRAKDRVPLQRFSTFLKQMTVDLERDPEQYPDGNVVEFHKRASQGQAPTDGFTIRRLGDGQTRVRITIYLDQHPEVFKIRPELGNVLSLKEDTRIGAIQALWNYIKLNGLQDSTDRKRIKLNKELKEVFGDVDSLLFTQLPERVNRFLLPAEPIVLHYTINPSIPPPDRPVAYDVEVQMDDINLKTRMQHVVVTMAPETIKELAKIDEEIGMLVQSLQNSHMKRTFLHTFADNPQEFIQTWLESQSRDLDSVLGSGPSEGATLRQDDLRRSEFFRLPWVEEAVAVHEGLRVAAKAGM